MDLRRVSDPLGNLYPVFLDVSYLHAKFATTLRQGTTVGGELPTSCNNIKSGLPSYVAKRKARVEEILTYVQKT